MKIKLSALRKEILALVKEVGRHAQAQDLCAYLVGGVVRDLILKRGNLDLDFVIEGDAIKFAKAFAKAKKADVVVYPQFGTATITLKNGLKFDLATARKERYPYSGALPVVEKGSLADDIFRRDFTINTLALAVNPNRFAELIDLFDGLADLKARKIRILHDQSFVDDPTRILRAVRFEQRLGFKIDERTLSLLRQALSEGVEKNVKLPRYFEEFKKILGEPHQEKYLQRLLDLSALPFCAGGLVFDKSVSKLFKEIVKSIIYFHKKVAPKEKLETWLVYFMALLHKMSFDQITNLLDNLNLKKEDREKIVFSEFKDRALVQLAAANLTPFEIYCLLKPLDYETIIYLRSSASSAVVRWRIDNFLLKFSSVKLGISGSDLKRLGVLPGRKMGEMLEEVLKQKVNGQVKSYKDEVKLAKYLISNQKN